MKKTLLAIAVFVGGCGTDGELRRDFECDNSIPLTGSYEMTFKHNHGDECGVYRDEIRILNDAGYQLLDGEGMLYGRCDSIAYDIAEDECGFVVNKECEINVGNIHHEYAYRYELEQSNADASKLTGTLYVDDIYYLFDPYQILEFGSCSESFSVAMTKQL